MATILSDLEAVEDFAYGLAFYGTGGGGRVGAGRDMLAPLVAAGTPIVLADPDELRDDAWLCWAIVVGGRDPDEPPAAAELAQFGLKEERNTLVQRLAAAAGGLAEFRGVCLGALVSMELSSGGVAATVLTARELGVPVLDSDFVGRAIPEVGLSKPDILGSMPAPLMMIDRWGNEIILKSTASAAMADRFGRMASRAAYGRGIGTAGNLVQLRDARPALVRGSLVTALRTGAALRSGAGTGEPLRPLIELTGGRVICQGEAVATEWLSDEPYTWRQLVYRIKGVGDFARQGYRIWVKNEHHVVWRDDTVVATSPDVIAVLDADTNEPLTTLGDVTPSRRIVIFATGPLDPAWHTPRGLALLGPRHFGFDFDHMPLTLDGRGRA
jgi:DUF917 family protein